MTVEPEGVEPSSPVCKTGILPLDDGPVWTVLSRRPCVVAGPSGLEPDPPAFQTGAQPTTPGAFVCRHAERGERRACRPYLAGCQRPVAQGGRRRPRRSRRAIHRLPGVDSNHGIPVQSRASCRWTNWQSPQSSVAPKGLEPSPLRVKAAFSASRDPVPRTRRPPLRRGPLPSTILFERSTSRFVLLVCSFLFRAAMTIERRTSPASRQAVTCALFRPGRPLKAGSSSG